MWPFNSEEFQRLSARLPTSTQTVNIQNNALTAAPTSPDKQMTPQEMMEAMMDELVAAGAADFLLIRNQQIREWWESVVARRKKEQELKERQERQRQLRESALSKLSSEEREALGVNDTRTFEELRSLLEIASSTYSQKLDERAYMDAYRRYKDTKF